MLGTRILHIMFVTFKDIFLFLGFLRFIMSFLNSIKYNIINHLYKTEQLLTHTHTHTHTYPHPTHTYTYNCRG